MMINTNAFLILLLQRRGVPYRGVPYRGVPYRVIPYGAVPYRVIPYQAIPYPPWDLMMIRHNPIISI